MKREHEIPYDKKVDCLNETIDLCQKYLFAPEGEQVLSYLRETRKLSDKTIACFKLGAFPRYPDIVATRAGSFSAWKCGIVGFNSDGTLVSKFSTHQVIIPIYNQYQDPVALMGRSMFSSEKLKELRLPKYINSSYKKSNNLYGLNLAKDVIRERNEVILVEGNFDVITAFQHGLKNVVCTSKASVSKMQLSLAARYSKNIRILFDNDNAGQEGTKRALDQYKQISGIELNTINLPNHVKDIDELFLKGMGSVLGSYRQMTLRRQRNKDEL
jgi:DNA primase